MIAIIFSFETQYAKSETTTSCKGKSWCGSTCSATCGEGFTASCRNGFFWPTCQCVSSIIHYPPIDTPTSSMYSDAIAFALFLHSSSNLGFQAMEASVNDAIIGSSNQDWSLYWNGSDSFFLQFDNLSSSDQSVLMVWRTNHGYTDSF